MHESGIIQKTIESALEEAKNRGGRLVSVHLRVGVLAGGSAGHLRVHFEDEIDRRGLNGIVLHVSEEPAFLGGVEILSIEVAEPR